jgi:2-iminoacetate synthase
LVYNAAMIINKQTIQQLISEQYEDAAKIKEIISKARAAQGLELSETASLLAIESPELLAELFTTAKAVKEEIYGKRIVLFAPLYISNLCSNECLYCAFRATNKALHRRSLNQTEIAQEVTQLIEQGQKRLLLVAGESHTPDYLDYVLESIATVYNIKSKHGEIRRVNVNLAPLTTEDFKRLKTAQIGTYQLFQETYHPEVYNQVHVAGKKADYAWRLTAIDRAIEAGIDDVGIGVLFGLADWRFEILALLQHAQYLDAKFGIGPHTISVPRLEPATGSDLASNPPHPVSDADFYKIIAILRLALPYTGIILSTRENAETRRIALELGVSQISAGSKTNPGGYSEEDYDASQFALGDHRSIDTVVKDIAQLGYFPSFCTACYRSGRTGEKFMELAKSGKIKNMCQPNSLITFAEYLQDYATAETKKIGLELIKKELAAMPTSLRTTTENLLEKIAAGKRDLYL